MPSPHRIPHLTAIMLTATLLSACLGNNGSTPTSATPPPPVVNTMTVTVDSGPAAAPGAINHAYVTVRVCVPGSTTQCANVDHVLLDTGSWGLRLVRSVLAANTVTLSAETDTQGRHDRRMRDLRRRPNLGTGGLGRRHLGGRGRGQIAGADHG